MRDKSRVGGYMVSVLAESWTKEVFLEMIRNLDKRTGLDGAALEIILFNCGRRLGYYKYGKQNAFGFNLSFFNDPSINVAGKFSVLRHEYAHYYDHVTKLDKYVVRSQREKSHGADWKFACHMLNANPRRCYNEALFKDVRWSEEEINARFRAEDVKKIDICGYLSRWNQVPLDDEKASKIVACIKKKNPEGFYDIGNIVIHPLRGFGVVADTIPCVDYTQKIFVRFDDKTEGVFCSQDLWRDVDGIAVPYTRGQLQQSSC